MRAVVTLALVAACYSPRYRNCEIACGAGCPSGLYCDDVTQRCSADPSPGACVDLVPVDAGPDGPPGPFAQRAYIKASNTNRDDLFGWAVALSADGSTLAVSAEDEASRSVGLPGDNSAPKAGAVYVFGRSGETWSQQAYLKAANADAGDEFGTSLALSADGSTLAVGAWLEASGSGLPGDNSASSAGAAYVFTRSGPLWTQTAYLKASNIDSGDEFATAIALSGDGKTLAVGAPFEASATTGINGDQTSNAAGGAGAVYVFTFGVSWTQQAYVKASNTESSDTFGSSVALSGDGSTLAVGAPLEDSSATGVGGSQTDNGAMDSGAVYVFARSGTTWSQQAYVKASNTEAGDQFGAAVALSGDGATLAASALFEDSAATGVGGDQASSGASNSGAVYVFARSGATWSQQAYVKATNTGPGDDFGIALSLSSDGSSLAVGANFEASAATGIGGNQADDSASNAGAAYLFARSGTIWIPRLYIKASNTEADDQFGYRVAVSADASTLAVGAISESSAATGIDGNQSDNSASKAGAVYVFR